MSGIIQFSYLGRYGQFGNQLFQYAFARSYAEIVGAQLEVPDWIGRHVFKGLADDPYPSRTLPITQVDEFQWGITDIDLLGYYQHPAALKIVKKESVKKWFQFKDAYLSAAPTLPLCAHLRRGDYIIHEKVFAIVSELSYLRACEKFGFDDRSITWVSTEHRNAPLDMGITESMLYDFILLMKCKVFLRSNSTFSWWAGELGDSKVYSPLIDSRTGMQHVRFVRGNHPRIVYPPYALGSSTKEAGNLVLA